MFSVTCSYETFSFKTEFLNVISSLIKKKLRISVKGYHQKIWWWGRFFFRRNPGARTFWGSLSWGLDKSIGSFSAWGQEEACHERGWGISQLVEGEEGTKVTVPATETKFTCSGNSLPAPLWYLLSFLVFTKESCLPKGAAWKLVKFLVLFHKAWCGDENSFRLSSRDQLVEAVKYLH